MWEKQERLPACDLKTLLSRYIVITAPASQAVLALLGAHAMEDADKNKLQLLATVRIQEFYNICLKVKKYLFLI